MSSTTPLSRRAQQMPASPIRRLAPFAVQARKAGKTVYPLNIGQPDIPTPGAILDRLRSYDDACVPYGPSQGLPEFIEALRSYYAGIGVPLAAEEIFVTTAGSEALVFTLGALCDVGEQVIVFEPFYTNYNGFAAMMGVELVPVTTTCRRAPRSRRRSGPARAPCSSARPTTRPARSTATPRSTCSPRSAANAASC
jgi:aspartate aminotransferase